jgi:hypothetical protein
MRSATEEEKNGTVQVFGLPLFSLFLNVPPGPPIKTNMAMGRTLLEITGTGTVCKWVPSEKQAEILNTVPNNRIMQKLESHAIKHKTIFRRYSKKRMARFSFFIFCVLSTWHRNQSINRRGTSILAETSATNHIISLRDESLSVLWIRIRKDPKLFAGSGSVTRGYGSGSGFGSEAGLKSY